MDKILQYLFRGYSKRLKDTIESQQKLTLDAYKSVFSPKDLIRERLKGIKPNLPESNTILQNHLASLDDVSRLAFLSKAYDIVKNNPTFKLVLESLIVEQEHYSMLEAKDIEEVNFGRATINGHMHIEESLAVMSGRYEEEKETQKPLTDEEKLSSL